MHGKIKTTGQMRNFLANMLVGIKNGDLDIQKASQITKMVGQINESFYAEVKVAKTKLEAGEQVGRFGSMTLGQEDLEDDY